MAAGIPVLAPDMRPTPRQWLERNLFDGVWNTLLTVALALVLGAFFAGATRWVLQAHWAVIVANLRFWLIGFLPAEVAWRAYWAGGLVAMMAILTAVGQRARVRPGERRVGKECRSRWSPYH